MGEGELITPVRLSLSTASLRKKASTFAPPLTRLFGLDAYTQYVCSTMRTRTCFGFVCMPLETRPGSTHLINETRHGSDGAGIEVYDPTTGYPLKFEYLPGTEMMARNIPGLRNQHFVHHVW